MKRSWPKNYYKWDHITGMLQYSHKCISLIPKNRTITFPFWSTSNPPLGGRTFIKMCGDGMHGSDVVTLLVHR